MEMHSCICFEMDPSGRNRKEIHTIVKTKRAWVDGKDRGIERYSLPFLSSIFQYQHFHRHLWMVDGNGSILFGLVKPQWIFLWFSEHDVRERKRERDRKKSHRFGGRREFILGGHQIKSNDYNGLSSDRLCSDRLTDRDSNHSGFKKLALTCPKRRGQYHERNSATLPICSKTAACWLGKRWRFKEDSRGDCLLF